MSSKVSNSRIRIKQLWWWHSVKKMIMQKRPPLSILIQDLQIYKQRSTSYNYTPYTPLHLIYSSNTGPYLIWYSFLHTLFRSLHDLFHQKLRFLQKGCRRITNQICCRRNQYSIPTLSLTLSFHSLCYPHLITHSLTTQILHLSYYTHTTRHSRYTRSPCSHRYRYRLQSTLLWWFHLLIPFSTIAIDIHFDNLKSNPPTDISVILSFSHSTLDRQNRERKRLSFCRAIQFVSCISFITLFIHREKVTSTSLCPDLISNLELFSFLLHSHSLAFASFHFQRSSTLQRFSYYQQTIIRFLHTQYTRFLFQEYERWLQPYHLFPQVDSCSFRFRFFRLLSIQCHWIHTTSWCSLYLLKSRSWSLLPISILSHPNQYHSFQNRILPILYHSLCHQWRCHHHGFDSSISY